MLAAGNKLRKDLPSRVKIHKSVIDGNNAFYSSFLLVQENSVLEVSNSVIENNFSFD